MIEKGLKKKISHNWLNEFPELSLFAQNKLYKVLGLFIIGIEIIKMPGSDDYRPYFVCYPLWKDNLKKCLEDPIILQEILDSKDFQFNIPYVEHVKFFHEAVLCTKEKVLISLYENVRIMELFNLFDSQFSRTLIKSSPVAQAKLYESKLLAEFYLDINIQNLLNEIEVITKNWPPDLFNWKYGNVSQWLEGLKQKTDDRDKFLKQIEINKHDKKISKLKSSELIF